MSWHPVELQSIALPTKGAIVSGPFGSSIGSRFFVDDGIPVIRGNNLTKGSEKFIDSGFAYLTEDKAAEFKNCEAITDDIVFTAAGSIGQVGIIPANAKYPRYVISNKQLRVRIDQEKAIPQFVFLWLSSPRMANYLESMNNGGAVPLLNLGIIRKVPIPLPPLPTQRRIADILSAYDDLIENNRRRIQLLEQAARMIYKEWFVRLRFPGHEHVRIVDGVPEGWAKTPLSEIADITMGQSPKSIYYNEDGNGLPFHQGVTNFGVRFPSHQTYCTVKNRLAEPGDILFSVRAPVGRINITTDKIVIGRGLSAIRSKLGQQNLLFYALKSHFFKEDMMGGGAIFAAITKKDLHGVELVQAPDRIAEMFMEHVQPIDLQIENLEQTIDDLTQARDILLPRLMTGEVFV